jgi:hypothetical protein
MKRKLVTLLRQVYANQEVDDSRDASGIWWLIRMHAHAYAHIHTCTRSILCRLVGITYHPSDPTIENSYVHMVRSHLSPLHAHVCLIGLMVSSAVEHTHTHKKKGGERAHSLTVQMKLPQFDELSWWLEILDTGTVLYFCARAYMRRRMSEMYSQENKRTFD